MTINHSLSAVPDQGTNVVVAKASSHAFGVAHRRVSRGSFDGAQVTVVRRKDVDHALAVLAVIDCRHDQAVSKNFLFVWHLGPPHPEPRKCASLNRVGYVPKAGGTQEAGATSHQALTGSLQRARSFEALAFNEIKGQLMRRLQRTGLRVKDDTSDVASGAVFDRDLLHAHPLVASDCAHGVTTVFKAEPLLTAPSDVLLTHLQSSVCLAALILQGDDYVEQPRQFGSERATFSTVKPPRNRRTRLREDV